MKKFIFAFALFLNMYNQASDNVEKIVDFTPYPEKKELPEWSCFVACIANHPFLNYYPNECTYPQKNGATICLIDDYMYIYQPEEQDIRIPLREFHPNNDFEIFSCKRYIELPNGRTVRFTLNQSRVGCTYHDMPKITEAPAPRVQKPIRNHLLKSFFN